MDVNPKDGVRVVDVILLEVEPLSISSYVKNREV